MDYNWGRLTSNLYVSVCPTILLGLPIVPVLRENEKVVGVFNDLCCT